MECSPLTATRGGIDDTCVPPSFTVRQQTTIDTKLKNGGTIAVRLHSNVRAPSDFSSIGKEPLNCRVRRTFACNAVDTDWPAEVAPCDHIQVVAVDSKASNKCPII